MSEFKGTPGPWVNVGGWVDSVADGSVICKMHEKVYGVKVEDREAMEAR